MPTTSLTPVNDPLTTLSRATQSNLQNQAVDTGQDRFLTMLIAQLKNQDPLNPLDNAQLTSQLAQISTVQGIERLNTTLAALAGSFQAGQSLQAAGLVGRQVLVTGDRMELSAAGARAAFSLPQSVDHLTISVTDASGSVVHRVELGAQAAGTQIFEWDGMADSGARAVDGIYRFEIGARANGTAVTAETLSLGRVDSVTQAPGGTGGTILNLGRLGEIPFAAIRRIM
jgi:flagellar basal-body rod modification protein FlgD